MIPDSLKPSLIALLGQNLSTEDIDSLGKNLEPKFNSHILSGQPFGINLRPEEAARILINHFDKKELLPDLITMLINIALNDNTTILGRKIPIEGFDVFMQKMGTAGIKYDPVQGILRPTTPDEDKEVNWGILREGDVYYFSYLSVDIVGNSKIQLKYPRSEIEEVYGALLRMIEHVVRKYHGRIWSWAGDGGLVAFYLGDKSQSAVRCAIEIHLRLMQFNLDPAMNKFGEPIHLRIAAHEGETVYKENKGAILSDAINYVAHLEKSATERGGVSISENTYRNLPRRLQGVFTAKGEFENINHYSVSLSFPWLDFAE